MHKEFREFLRKFKAVLQGMRKIGKYKKYIKFRVEGIPWTPYSVSIEAAFAVNLLN
jgi:hypothetical protein